MLHILNETHHKLLSFFLRYFFLVNYYYENIKKYMYCKVDLYLCKRMLQNGVVAVYNDVAYFSSFPFFLLNKSD